MIGERSHPASPPIKDTTNRAPTGKGSELLR